MSWSFVGTGTDLGNVHTGSRTVTVGNLLIAIYISGSNADVPTIADSNGNSWTKIGATHGDGNNNSETWWWAPATANPNLTISGGAGGDEGMAILEWHSTAGNVPSDSFETENRREQVPGDNVADQTTSNTVSAPANNGDLFISWAGDVTSGANVFTAGTGFADRFTGTATIAIRVEDLTQVTAASKTATWTNGGFDNSVTFAAFFKEPVAGSVNTNITPSVGAETLTAVAPIRSLGTVLTPITP